MAECNDKKCGVHGVVKTHGRVFTGVVANAKAQHTATVTWDRIKYVSKYERYEKKRSVVHAHNPPCIDAKIGDKVIVSECKPLSKTKHFVIVEKKGVDINFVAKKQTKTEDKKTVEENANKKSSINSEDSNEVS